MTRNITTLLICLGFQALCAQPSLEVFPSLQTAGLNVYFNNLTDPEKDASATLAYKPSGAAEWRQGFPLTTVSEKNRCSGSLFWLEPGHAYDVRVTLSDPTTPGLNAVLDGLVQTRAETDLTPGATKLIVSPTGTGNACSEGQPCALPTALAQAQAGQDIELRGGTYYTGNLSLTQTGAAGAPITLRGRAGETAILDGADPDPYTWQPANGTPGTYYTTLKEANANVNCVTVDGVRLFPYRKLLYDLTNLQITCILGYPVPAGVSGMFRDPRPTTVIPFQVPNPYYRKLFVHLADNSDPTGHEVVVSLQKTGIKLENLAFVRFHNLTFQHYGVKPGGWAISAKNCNELVFDQCHFAHNDVNINFAGNSNRLTVQYCTFQDNTDWDTYIGKATYEPASPFLCDGTLPDLYPFSDRVAEVGGISLDQDFIGRGLLLRGNTFMGYMDGAHGCPPMSAPEQPVTQEVDIFDNQFQGGDDGIELEGWAGNVRFYHNRLADCGAAVSLAPVRTGPVYLIGNVISDFHETQSTIEGYPDLMRFGGTPFKFQSGYDGKIGQVYAFHNTVCVKGTGKALGLEIYGGTSILEGFTAKNNIFFAEKNRALVLRGGAALPPVDLDYNNYVNADTLVRVQWSGGLQYFSNLDAFRSAYGYETHGLNLDPLFTDTAANDFHLLPGSPCIDAGVVIPGINDLFYKNAAPDMGAFETALVATAEPERGALRIFPNPAGSSIHLEGAAGTVTIRDVTGRLVLTTEASFKININNLLPGVYVVRAGGMVGRFVKQ